MNTKGQIGTTMTWIVAFAIICFFIVIYFLAVFSIVSTNCVNDFFNPKCLEPSEVKLESRASIPDYGIAKQLGEFILNNDEVISDWVETGDREFESVFRKEFLGESGFIRFKIISSSQMLTMGREVDCKENIFAIPFEENIPFCKSYQESLLNKFTFISREGKLIEVGYYEV